GRATAVGRVPRRRPNRHWSFRAARSIGAPVSNHSTWTRLAEVRSRIADAERAAGRAAGSVRLVAVSKGQPVFAVRDAYVAGHRDFGESYGQELCGKASLITDLADLTWHFIGHLQRNKARYVVEYASTVAVDDAETVRELDKRALAAGKKVGAIVEVNVAGE